MSTDDFIIALFCRVDTVLTHLPKHSQAGLYPSELVTLALLCAFKGGGSHTLLSLAAGQLCGLVSRLPDRTRLFRLFQAHRDWAEWFLAEPTVLGVIDSYGIELVHPWRESRSDGQLGTKGLSNHRWIIGGKLVYVVNQHGQIVAWTMRARMWPILPFSR